MIRTFLLGSTIELQVNVSASYLARYIQTLIALIYKSSIALNNILCDQGLECPDILYQFAGSYSIISFVTFPFIFTTYSKKFCLTYMNVGN